MKLYCRNAEKWEEAARKPYFSDKELKVREVQKGYILPILCELENLGNLNENWQSSVLR